MEAQQLNLPSDDDIQLAEEAIRDLRGSSSSVIHLVPADRPNAKPIVLPEPAYRMILQILGHISNGDAVTILPVHAELTTQQAADILNVSRPYLISLLEAGKMPFHKVGTHRRIKLEELLAYQRHDLVERKKILDELANESQELGLDE